MIKVTPGLALGLFGIILLVSALVAWWMKSYSKFDSSGFHTFIVVLGGLGVFVTFMFYFSIVSLQQQQQELNKIHETTRYNSNILDSMMNEMNEASKIIPNFVLSLNPLTTKKYEIEKDEINPQTITEKSVLSYKIFSLWQEAILANNFIAFDTKSIIANFLQRASSYQLHEQWLVSKINFNCKTQKFGNLLFKHGLSLNLHEELNSDIFTKTAKNIIEDNDFENIISDCI